LEGHGGEVRALAALRDGRLASAGDDCAVRLSDPARSANPTTCLEGHGRGVEALAVLPDGRLASASHDGTIRLWDLRPRVRLWQLTRGTESLRLEGFDNSVWETVALVILPDGRLVSADGSAIRVWDPARGVETARLKARGNVLALAVLPDGTLVSGDSQGGIRLWNATLGVEIGHLNGHDHRGANALAALPDGRLASGSGDHTIRLWDSARGAEIARLEVDGAVTCLAALPGGGLVAGDVLGRLHWLLVVE
jgi:WD40 repeat protein